MRSTPSATVIAASAGHPPDRAPRNVVDVFCGAGALSLGFDLHGGGEAFRTVMALDLKEPMVRVFNDNHRQPVSGAYRVGRQVDLSDFFSEAEVLAFYLDHYAVTTSDRELLLDLAALGLPEFTRRVAQIDAAFLRAFGELRQTAAYGAAYRALLPGALNQTSVQGVHAALHLPRGGLGRPSLGPLLWTEGHQEHREGMPEGVPRSPVPGDAARHANLDVPAELRDLVHGRLELLWDREVGALKSRADGQGRGQLASAARKIESVALFLSGEVGGQLRSAWLAWRGERDALRIQLFGSEAVYASLRSMYTRSRRVSVLVGGPPCQGFSRAGRGKLRSLREQSVHVQYDATAGDRRNHLLHQYVLFVGALAPEVFVFENVRHFQSDVVTQDGVFSAPDVLAQAITELSQAALHYDVAHRILDAADHGVPQYRERFFMVGARVPAGPGDDGTVRSSPEAAEVLDLPRDAPVPLMTALMGLPAPFPCGETAGVSRRVQTTPVRRFSGSSEERYVSWVQQDPPPALPDRVPGEVDGHSARVPRQDDRAFFALLGPGRRWADYRADDSVTVSSLRTVLAVLLDAMHAHPGGGNLPLALQQLGTAHVQALRDAVDGSLPLRLLLESIAPVEGEAGHHLLRGAYLRKGDGQHGDWLSRMAPGRPSKTILSHMGKDTYAFVHPFEPRTLSVREAARIQGFPDWYRFGSVGLVDAFTVIGNAVSPLVSHQLAGRVLTLLDRRALPVRSVDPVPAEVHPVSLASTAP